MRKVTALRSEEATNESWLKIQHFSMECGGDGDMHILVGAIADETACVPVTCEVPGVLEARSHEISVIGAASTLAGARSPGAATMANVTTVR